MMDPIQAFLTGDKPLVEAKDTTDESTSEDSKDTGSEDSNPDVETPEEDATDTAPEDKESKDNLMHMLNGSTSKETDPKKLLSNVKGIKVICLQ